MRNLEVLKAIEVVRQELIIAAKVGDNLALEAVHERLISLYASLNVHEVIGYLEKNVKE